MATVTSQLAATNSPVLPGHNRQGGADAPADWSRWTQQQLVDAVTTCGMPRCSAAPSAATWHISRRSPRSGLGRLASNEPERHQRQRQKQDRSGSLSRGETGTLTVGGSCCIVTVTACASTCEDSRGAWRVWQFPASAEGEWTAAAGRAAVVLHDLMARGTSVRDHGATRPDVLAKHTALLWSSYTLGRKSPAELWSACTRLLAARLLAPADTWLAPAHTAEFATLVLRVESAATHGDPVVTAAICKPALQLLLTSCRKLFGHGWRPPEAASELRAALDGLHRRLSEAAASAQDGDAAGLRSVAPGPVPGSVPGQSERAVLHEAICWTLLAKAQCLGELGVASELGEDHARPAGGGQRCRPRRHLRAPSRRVRSVCNTLGCSRAKAITQQRSFA